MSSAVLRSWLNSLARAWSTRHSAKRTRSRRPRRAQLEVGQLEDRCVPSTLSALASFNNANGANPTGSLIQDSAGNFLGTTQAGGANSEGTVFELAHDSSTITVLASFSNSTGTFPQAGLIEDSSGNLFRTTSNGGANNKGTVFELAHGSSTITALASFNSTNGADPVGSLIEDSSGNLFGMANTGGTSGFGTVFELAHASSTITALASLNSSTGDFPNGSLIEDSSGNLFGVAEQGGTNNAGTVFELVQGSNTITVLASFDNAYGTVPIGNLNADSRGNLFGTAYTGGANGFGTVFELSQRPSISMQPLNATATAGQAPSVSLTVAASEGTAPLSYRWQIA